MDEQLGEAEMELAFDSTTAAPHDARLVLRAMVARRHPEIVGDAELVLSELVTNVVRHTGDGGAIRLRCTPGAVRVEVTDADLTPLVMRSRPADGVGGVGLRVVDALASAWGVERMPDGKTVWAELRCPPRR